MTTLFSGVTIGYWNTRDNYMYGTLTGDISRSGNTVRISNIQLSITSRWWSSGSSHWKFSLHYSTFEGTISAPPTSHSVPDVYFEVAPAQEAAVIGWSTSDGYSGEISVRFPSGVVEPSGLYISNLSATANSVTGNVAISSWGNPWGSGNSYREINVSPSASEPTVYRRFQKQWGADMSGYITVTNNSEQLGGTNIQSNTFYYVWGFAHNGQGFTMTSYTASYSIVTAPSPPTITNMTAIDARSASFVITDVSGGTANQIQLKYRYRVSGGTYSSWTNAGDSSTHQSRTITLTGLDSNTSYDVDAKAVASDGKESTVTTVNNAFKTTKVAIAIVAQREETAQTQNKVNEIFNLSFSAVSTASTVYEYQYQYKKSSSLTWDSAIVDTSSSTTKSLTLLLDANTTYDFRIRARISGGVEEEYGDYVVSTFTTSSYSPGNPIVVYRFNDDRTKVYVDITPVGLVTKISCVATSNGFELINDEINTSGEMVTFEANLSRNGSLISPDDIEKFDVVVVQTYNSEQATVLSSFNTPWRIIGVVTSPNGTQLNIINVRVKKKNGTLTSGDYNHPFVTK